MAGEYEIPNWGANLPAAPVTPNAAPPIVPLGLPNVPAVAPPPIAPPPLPQKTPTHQTSSRTDLRSVNDNMLNSQNPEKMGGHKKQSPLNKKPREISYRPHKQVKTKSTINKVDQFGAGTSRSIEHAASKNYKAKFVEEPVNYKRDCGIMSIMIVLAVGLCVTCVCAVALFSDGNFVQFKV
ncbi:hypothetical protein M3Y94_01120500 [Aphelenchoides besseyi]|nr:hypothetical protein M3Y94_01120500 [Aphelenchoides besseyi]